MDARLRGKGLFVMRSGGGGLIPVHGAAAGSDEESSLETYNRDSDPKAALHIHISFRGPGCT